MEYYVDKKWVKKFLEEPRIQELLYKEDMDKIFQIYHNENPSVGDLTLFFIQNNINPLTYMTKTSPYMYKNFDIETFTIPPNITGTGRDTFSNCRKLKSITLPKSLKYVGVDTFFSCIYLKDVYYEGTKEDLSSIEICDGNYCLTNATWHFTRFRDLIINCYGE